MAKKFTKSQLRWLAESLTDKQMAFLLEEDSVNLQKANQNAGLAAQPQNPGMQSVDNNAAMKPQVQNASQNQNQQNQAPTTPQKDDKSQIKTVCMAIKNGKLAKIEPSQLNNFLKNAQISTKNTAQAVKFAIEYVAGMMKTPQKIVMKELNGIVAGISNCLGALTTEKNAVAESIAFKARKCGLNTKYLAENIKRNNSYQVYNAGRLLEQQNLPLVGKIAKLKSLNESKQIIKANWMMRDELHHQVNEYFSIIKDIKNLEHLCEANRIKTTKYSLMKKMTQKRAKAINESVSAIKYALKYYKENK